MRSDIVRCGASAACPRCHGALRRCRYAPASPSLQLLGLRRRDGAVLPEAEGVHPETHQQTPVQTQKVRLHSGALVVGAVCLYIVQLVVCGREVIVISFSDNNNNNDKLKIIIQEATHKIKWKTIP